ncbi:MAG: hypothetical protein ACI92E_001478 [Oceanicoccus sp.]|jgi:hypothetical protein
MLRVSAITTETDIDLQMINGSEAAATKGVEYGYELMKFAESFTSRNPTDLARDRHMLLEVAGEKVLVDAAGVAANFQRMVRIADSMGIPVDNMASTTSQEIRQELNLNRFGSSRNTLSELN